MKPKKIAIAGFQHETNCFNPTHTGLVEFEMADSWPEMLTGSEVISKTMGMNLPIAGFSGAAAQADIDLLPLFWCAAEPAGLVTDEAFETICDLLQQGLEKAGPLDGVYLDLHGAMVTESFSDGEGEVLRRAREIIGYNTPLVASLDLHANISADMVELADYLAIYRTYPHLDMAQTGARCVKILQRLLAGETLCKDFRQIPYLIPLHAQYTGTAPINEIYRSLEDIEETGVLADIALGFTAADFPHTGPSCVAYANNKVEADKAVCKIYNLFLDHQKSIDQSLLSIDEAVDIARQAEGKPVVLADVQDNPGAGGASDTTGLLNSLITGGVKNVLLGLMHDPEAAAIAHKAGNGASIHLALGGKSPGQLPIEAEFKVLNTSDGNCCFSGEMYGGGTATLGKTAALRLTKNGAQIDIVVTSIRNQCLDLALFTHIGLDPRAYRVICVKSTVHFRAAFEPIASEIYAVASPGLFLCDLNKVPYQNLEKRNINVNC